MIFSSKMRYKALGGQAPPEPAGELTALSDHLRGGENEGEEREVTPTFANRSSLLFT